VPEISNFYGIRITMYYGDHLPPHFHATYGESSAMIGIESGAVLHGDIPTRAARLVREWVELHRAELSENWNLALDGARLNKIEPL
jgi:hypothetical protein